jgi:regulatory protein
MSVCESLALRLLTQREHSRQELAQKLRRLEECDAESVAVLLDKLQELGYLDDLRYAGSFVRSSVTRGHGPMKIAYGLRERGVGECIANQALAEAETDWEALAQTQRSKKFGVALPTDFKERARQSRFLAGRGFYTETIKAVFL